MESSLNEAHHQERKAETFLQSRRFQDAVKCLEKTVELLEEAMKLTTSERALESIRLQRDHQVRRQRVIGRQQLLFVARRRATLQRALKAAMASRKGKTPAVSTAGHLQMAIYRNIDDNDSLLQFLHKDLDEDDVAATATRPPKDDKTIIEELQVNNRELRRLVDVLVADLDESRAEVVRLGQLVHDMRLESRPESDGGQQPSTVLMTADSSSNSPFVFSTTSSSSSGGGSSSVENAETAPTDLPPLAPLEMPPLIDFNRSQENDEVIVPPPTNDSPNSSSSSP